MAIRYYAQSIGSVTIKNGDKKYKVEIRQGNCLAVFIAVSKNPNATGKDDAYIHTLFRFFADEQHIKTMMKLNYPLFGNTEVAEVKLNTYYKESLTLCKYLPKAGYKVTLFYKEPKTKKK